MNKLLRRMRLVKIDQRVEFDHGWHLGPGIYAKNPLTGDWFLLDLEYGSSQRQCNCDQHKDRIQHLEQQPKYRIVKEGT